MQPDSEHANQFDNSARAPYFDEALQDAERLMEYAAEIGLDVGDDIRTDTMQARAHSRNPSEEQVARLLEALTQLVALVKPVTAESLQASVSGAGHSVFGSYWRWAVGLAVIIVPFSVASFVTSAISAAVHKDIADANELLVKISPEVRPPANPTAAGESNAPAPPAVSTVGLTELQQFASLIRAIDGRARRLNALMFHFEQDPYAHIRNDPQAIHEKFQLPADLPNHRVEAVDSLIPVYQDVRYFAQTLLDDTATIYGAIATCLLPVLYALLGTCAYLLRSFEDQMRTRTFIQSGANSARFLIAGIGGAVVGLFNNFTITQGTTTIPPLAIAFLVGYAVDVFFSFLEGLLQTFTKAKSPAGAAPPLPVPART